ncbi:hypothetical protein ACI2OX_22155 [Bacillus sp. N9]
MLLRAAAAGLLHKAAAARLLHKAAAARLQGCWCYKAAAQGCCWLLVHRLLQGWVAAGCCRYTHKAAGTRLLPQCCHKAAATVTRLGWVTAALQCCTHKAAKAAATQGCRCWATRLPQGWRTRLHTRLLLLQGCCRCCWVAGLLLGCYKAGCWHRLLATRRCYKVGLLLLLPQGCWLLLLLQGCCHKVAASVATRLGWAAAAQGCCWVGLHKAAAAAEVGLLVAAAQGWAGCTRLLHKVGLLLLHKVATSTRLLGCWLQGCWHKVAVAAAAGLLQGCCWLQGCCCCYKLLQGCCHKVAVGLLLHKVGLHMLHRLLLLLHKVAAYKLLLHKVAVQGCYKAAAAAATRLLGCCWLQGCRWAQGWLLGYKAAGYKVGLLLLAAQGCCCC